MLLTVSVGLFLAYVLFMLGIFVLARVTGYANERRSVRRPARRSGALVQDGAA